MLRRPKFEILEKRDVLIIVAIFAFIGFMFIFRGEEELRTLLIFCFYFAISLIYGIDSRLPIIAAIFLLISAAIFLTRSENFANKLAIYAYYFLVVGVVLQLIEYVREPKEKIDESEFADSIHGKCIAIASGKGGVGKTTIATNLALAFAKLKKRCLLVDLDVSMPGVDIAMGIKYEKSLGNVIFNNVKIDECVYNVNGCDVVPASPIPDFFKNVENIRRLKEVLNGIREKYEVIIMDFPPGSNVELLDEFSENTSMILVANPDKPSLVNLYNTKVLAQEKGSEIIGLALNKIHGYVDIENIEKTLQMPVIALLPEDSKVRESFDEGVPIVVRDEDREFSAEIKDLAKFLLGYLKELR